MQWRAIGKKFLYPPGWLLAVLILVSAAGLAGVFLSGMDQHPAAGIVYAVSFYTLCALVLFFVAAIPGRYRRGRERMLESPLGRRYLTDAAFRVYVSLGLSLAANLFCVGVNIVSWLRYRSMWFVILAGYYGILAVMRFLLLGGTRGGTPGQDRLWELRRARWCACVLLAVNLVLTGAVMMILYQDRGFSYQGNLIYAVAGYTFYMTIRAIVDLVKFRKYQSPVMTAAKIVALSAALVSMLSLETAMLSQFGADTSAEDRWLMVALTGAGVSAAVIGMAVCMLRRCAAAISAYKEEK